jgi:hypothetical protein
MKSILITLFLFALTATGSAQFVIQHDTVWKNNVLTNGSPYELWDTITNTTNTQQTLTWTLGYKVLPTGWSCAGIHDPYASYNCFDTVMVRSAVLQPNQKGSFMVEVLAATNASSGPAIVTLNTSAGKMVYIFNSSPLAINNYSTSDITIYPSLVEDRIYVKGNVANVESYEIINATGNTIMHQTHNHSSNIEIDITNYVSGFYFLKLTQDDGHYVIRKWMKLD